MWVQNESPNDAPGETLSQRLSRPTSAPLGTDQDMTERRLARQLSVCISSEMTILLVDTAFSSQTVHQSLWSHPLPPYVSANQREELHTDTITSSLHRVDSKCVDNSDFTVRIQAAKALAEFLVQQPLGLIEQAHPLSNILFGAQHKLSWRYYLSGVNLTYQCFSVHRNNLALLLLQCYHNAFDASSQELVHLHSMVMLVG